MWQPRSCHEPGGGARATGTRAISGVAPSREREPEPWGHVVDLELPRAGMGARAAGTHGGPGATPSWEREPWGHVAASELLSAGRWKPLS
jgi:hypothetical protein